jgi:glycerophosphoryl diester phosphodiesterase
MALHPDFQTIPIAHRGLHNFAEGVPENSPAAFARAIEKGYGIELDLQCSADGQAMVFHDLELDRLTDETGLVQEKTAAKLGQIRLKNGADCIPTLAQTLAQVNGQVPLLIEIKDQDGQLGKNVGPIGDDITRLLKYYKGPVAVMSYNPHAIAAVGALARDVSLGLVTGNLKDPFWDVLPDEVRQHMAKMAEFDASGACFISHNQNNLNSPHVARLKARGIPVLCWTIRSQEHERQARKVADNITFEDYLA